MRKLTTQEFISKAQSIHGDKYNYSFVNYINARTKIKIICKVHGVFEQKADGHLQGNGCPKCFGNRKHTTESFITKANQIHNNKYDYSTINYINMRTKITIICKHHGTFKQTPHTHLKGHGCPKCYFDNERLSFSHFLLEANKIHNNKYNYVKDTYINMSTKVLIKCPTHGIFEQFPYSHLKGHGCPICKESHGEKKIRNYLKENNIKFESQKTFSDCRGKKNPLPFDFYLSDCNILIEYDGRHHYESIKYFGGDERLQQTQNNDKIKTEYCKQNNIQLIRIPYWEFNNIEFIMDYII